MSERSRSGRRPPPLPKEAEPERHDTDRMPAAKFDDETPHDGRLSPEPPDLHEGDEPMSEEGTPSDHVRTMPDYPLEEAASGDKTEILQVAGAEEAEPLEEVALVRVETPDGKSSEVSVSGGRLVIGRAPECDLVLPDQLISRTHAVIELGTQGWTIADQQSGNGTFLNGKRIEESLLQDGDVITLGKARLTFTIPGLSAADPAKTTLMPSAGAGGTAVGVALPSPAKKRRLLLVAAAVAALIGVLGIIKMAVRPRGPTPEEIARRQEIEREQERQQRAEDLFGLLKQVTGESKWGEAAPLVAELEQLRPNDPTVAEYRQTISREGEAEKAMLEAQARLAVEDFDTAITILGQVPENSLQIEKAKGLRTLVLQKKLDFLLVSARARLGEKDFEQVIAIADQALQLQPENEAAAALKREAEQTLERKKAADKKTTRPVNTASSKHSHPAAKGLLRGECLAFYLQGDLNGAIAQAPTSSVSEEGIGQLRKFEKLYRHGLELASNPGLVGKAAEFLLQAEQIDQKLAGGEGKLVREIREKLSKSFFLTGVDNHNRKRYPEAFQAYKKALKYDPGMQQPRKRLEELAQEAKKLYEAAYIFKANSPDKALEMCETVMKMVEPDNYAYDRCQKLVGILKAVPGSSGEQQEDDF